MHAVILALAILLSGNTYPHRDYRLTPGVVATRDVAAICQAGFAGDARSERPVTVKLRNQVLESYGIPKNAKGYTLDHVIPIELGGATNDARNLYPGEPTNQRAKDKVENAMHRAVCEGGLALWKAQGCMSLNWHLCERWYG